ncbi:RlpA-like double-psi beta-barrel-protein domain-containing protein-containing protein [Gamsiella multidivaricata]|uniref:RlpA-like double-psi beta-barrel-protein domain-containing protein-containing protein n=1 Tax=Gamsiella multidivaricata TaxID=101098 RepID=UPI002220DD09|nr:RlpA-like double-psi beta-barrel-protein domain-containing protein-containing protein [Gamsiella multidivaricata]KAG0360496.1 hypothetical protein BGZ54_009502 [Gamsiella multidivaricata]KAI7820051.1 RlpA-like double-psi beta-barrel-protein domain-containing protein-containing protein [Gamsiella multidivaricata]
MTVFYKLAILAAAAMAATAAPIVLPATPGRNTTAILNLGLKDNFDGPIRAEDSTFSGRGTWFTDKSGSCGKSFDTNDMIVAMNAEQMDGTAQCGRTVRITANGKTVDAKVVDTCPSQFCSSGALDMSQAVFKKLAPLDKGVIQIKWQFA